MDTVYKVCIVLPGHSQGKRDAPLRLALRHAPSDNPLFDLVEINARIGACDEIKKQFAHM